VTHYSLSVEVKKAEEAKKQAAIDEDYETAASLKKQITKLKEEALTAQNLRKDYIEREPILRSSEILRQMNDIDAIFTKQFLETTLRSG